MTEATIRLVLFGLPGAGKSSLLGALAQAAQTQETLLNGKLVDRSHGLAGLQKNLYENQPQQTLDQVKSFAATFEPAAVAGKTSSPVDLVLVDGAGAATTEILGRQKPFDGRGLLGGEMSAADTLILVADAAADPAKLQRDFGQFAAFLRLFEQGRSQRNEIAGLPIYLVLTKCDLLAKKTDTTSAWIGWIEERKRQVDQGFHKYLDQQADRDNLAFGKVDLHVWATATGRPALADRPAKAQEPFGVAELFRQCLQEAGKFHATRLGAARRLKITVAGITGLVAAMLFLALGLYVTRPSPEVAILENALRGALPVEGGKAADRLKEPVDEKLKKLRDVQNSPDFDKLPAGTRKQVAAFIKEIEAYKKYNEQFLKKVRDPSNVKSEDELADIEKSLALVPLPDDYAAQWKDTRVGARTQQWLNAIKSLRTETDKTEAWFKSQAQKGEELKLECFTLLGKKEMSAKEGLAWLNSYKDFLAQEWPRPPGKRVPGAGAVTYQKLYGFDRVQQAREAWEKTKDSLRFVQSELEKKMPKEALSQ